MPSVSVAILLALAQTTGKKSGNADAGDSERIDEGEMKMGRSGLVSDVIALRSYEDSWTCLVSQMLPSEDVVLTNSASAHAATFDRICSCSDRPIADDSVHSTPSRSHPAKSTGLFSGVGGRSFILAALITAHQRGIVLDKASGKRCEN